MPDVMSPAQRSKLMSRIQGKNTSPEISLRRAAWKLGLRYRLHRRIGKTRPDLVFTGAKVAIFVDGCFWHCCPLHCVMPKNNREFWQKKLGRNVQRDAEATQVLTAAGWCVLRFWEHEIEASAETCARKIFKHVRRTHMEGGHRGE
ncbi:MAG: very short patch repair endonuclease [Thiobacillus sp.]|nr:very short patch repair endonuclease [Thiobacillus sp.]